MFLFRMDYRCFFCNGSRKKCVDERKFTPHGDYGDCLFYDSAQVDLEKLGRRDFKRIVSKVELAQYLSSINPDDERILQVLPHS